jgi:RNA polymerase sigma-70 factor (ECF subfamily)
MSGPGGGDDLDPLLRRARSGDTNALGELLERFRSYLTLLARLQISRRLRGKADPADLVQETFLDAHAAFPRFRGATEAELAGWLRQILAANLVDLIRRYVGAGRRDVRLERALVDEVEQSSRDWKLHLAAVQSSPSQQAARREQDVLLADAIARLPDAHREVLILHYLEGLSHPDVARRMGRTLDSVKNLWARALGKLRRSLGDQP